MTHPRLRLQTAGAHPVRDQRRQRGRWATVVLGIALAACQAAPGPMTSAVPGSNGPVVPTGSVAPSQGSAATLDPACATLLEDVDAIAADLAGTSGRQTLDALLSCLGVAVLKATDDPAAVQARMDGSEPVILEPVLDALEGDLDDGLLFDLDSLLLDLAEQGLIDRATNAPVTRAAFDAAMLGLASEGGADAIVPNLLMALGRARATRTGTEDPDSTWGEARLDALQFLLLGVGLLRIEPDSATTGRVSLAGLASTPRTTAAAAAGPLDAIGNLFRSAAQAVWSTARWVTCASRHAAQTQLLADSEPGDLWHQNGRQPSTGTVTFMLVRNVASDSLWMAAGCAPPARGQGSGAGLETIPGKTVLWKPDAVAEAHGSLSGTRFLTDLAGSVSATYSTVRETAAEPDQIPPNEQTETAAIALEILDLAPELPRTLMVTPRASKAIEVHWYEPKNYLLTVDFTFAGSRPEFAGKVRGTAEFVLRPTGPASPSGDRDFVGSGTLTFNTTPQSGGCRLTWDGGGEIDVLGQLTIADPFDAPTTMLQFGMRLDRIAKDVVTSTSCPPSPDLVVSQGQQSLLVLFVSATRDSRPGQGQATLGIMGFAGQPGGAAEATLSGGCVTPAICTLTGFYRIEPIAP